MGANGVQATALVIGGQLQSGGGAGGVGGGGGGQLGHWLEIDMRVAASLSWEEGGGVCTIVTSFKLPFLSTT